MQNEKKVCNAIQECIIHCLMHRYHQFYLFLNIETKKFDILENPYPENPYSHLKIGEIYNGSLVCGKWDLGDEGDYVFIHRRPFSLVKEKEEGLENLLEHCPYYNSNLFEIIYNPIIIKTVNYLLDEAKKYANLEMDKSPEGNLIFSLITQTCNILSLLTGEYIFYKDSELYYKERETEE